MFISRHAERMLAMLILIPAVSGCSLLGLGVGAVADAGKKNEVAPRLAASWRIEPGKKITLRLKDDSKISGRFRGVSRVRSDEYAAAYEHARTALWHNARLPQLEDEVDLLLESGDTVRARWLGFGPEHTLVDFGAGPVEVPVGEVAAVVDGRGNSVSGRSLLMYLWAGRLPVRSGIMLDVGRGRQELVSFDRIHAIEWAKHSGKKAGVIAGGIIDLMAFTAFAICSASNCLNVGFGN